MINKLWPLKCWIGIKMVKNGVVIDFTKRHWYTEEEVRRIEERFTSIYGQINAFDKDGLNYLISK